MHAHFAGIMAEDHQRELRRQAAAVRLARPVGTARRAVRWGSWRGAIARAASPRTLAAAGC